MKLVMEVLAAFAALVVLLIVAFYITLAWQLSRDPVVSLDDPDVLHLYEWAGVDGDAAMLINSYHPPANWAGDYQKVFSVRLGPSTIQGVVDRYGLKSGDRLTQSELQSIDFASFFTQDLDWFPSPDELKTKAYFVVVRRNQYQGEYLDSTHLLVLHPGSGVIYFVAGKM